MVKNEVGFLITAFDQLREVQFTIDMLRTKWKNTATAPIVLVISGDTDRSITYNNDPYTRVVHLDDIVGPYFKVLVSISIMKQIEHGMLEMKDMEREHGLIDSIFHMHGDILLLGEDGLFDELRRWKKTGKPVAADQLGAGGPWHIENPCGLGKDYHLKWFGHELMPQLFAVDHHFCKHTGYMYDMPVIGDLEVKATEWALIGNIHRATHEEGSGEALIPQVDVYKDKMGPYGRAFDECVHVVKSRRQQWGLHQHWGGFTHFGNTLKFTRAQCEERNRVVLQRYGLDLATWDNVKYT